MSHTSVNPNPNKNRSFLSTEKRFDQNYEMKEIFNKDPGPGTYSNSTAESSVMTGISSQTNTQGYGNGFVSKTERFKEMPMNQTKDPQITVGPGQYDPE